MHANKQAVQQKQSVHVCTIASIDQRDRIKTIFERANGCNNFKQGKLPQSKQSINDIARADVFKSKPLKQTTAVRIARRENKTTINLLMIVTVFFLVVECKDTCTYNPQKGLSSLDGLSNQTDSFLH